MKKLTPLLAAALLAACAPTGKPFTTSAIDQDATQVVAYRTFDVTNPYVQLGNQGCKMPGNSYYVFNAKPGSHVFDVRAGNPGGAFTANYDLKRGEKKYVKISYNQGKSSGASFGLLGYMVGAAIHQGEPDYYAYEVNQQAAMAELSNKKEALCR